MLQAERRPPVRAGLGVSASPLKVARTPIGSSPIRRTANERTRADAGSSHWTSSIASSNGASAARARKAATSPRGKVSRSGRAPGPVSVPSAAARARRWGSTSSSEISANTGSRRSETAPSEIGISASAHLDTSTRLPSRSAAATASRHRIVLPMPGSPRMRSAADLSRTRPAKATKRACSLPRPTSSKLGVAAIPEL